MTTSSEKFTEMMAALDPRMARAVARALAAMMPAPLPPVADDDPEEPEELSR